MRTVLPPALLSNASFKGSGLASALASALALVAACDSPGGSGGRVDCSLRPDLPVCRPDTSSTPDTTQPIDTTSPDDTSSPDDTTITLDTSPPQDSQDTFVPPEDTFVPPEDTFVPECSAPASRCLNDQAQTCSGGVWLTVDVCGGSTACQNGQCMPVAVCTNGQRRCSSNDVELCSGGQWTREQQCANGCSNGQCNPAPSGLACTDVFDCIIDAGCFETLPPSSSCTTPCLNQGSTVGRNEMNALLSCYAQCSYQNPCVIQQCSDERTGCLFDNHGSMSCEEVYDCLLECSTDACAESCWESGTVTAQALLDQTLSCYEAYCSDPQSAVCVNTCGAYIRACFP